MVINTGVGLRHQQQGVTLITVMIILIIVTLLGVSAMRMSLSGLTLAANSQSSNLLFQSADAGFIAFTTAVNSTPGKANLEGGILAAAQISENTEFSYCVTPKTGAASILTANPCDVTSTASYMSSRDAVATQVSFKVAKSNEMLLGSDSTLASQIAPLKVTVYTTAVLPSFGSATKSKINECLNLKINDDSADTNAIDTISITDCLIDNGAVSNTQVDESTYGYDFGT